MHDSKCGNPYVYSVIFLFLPMSVCECLNVRAWICVCVCTVHGYFVVVLKVINILRFKNIFLWFSKLYSCMFGSSMRSPDFICSDNGITKYVWKAAEKRGKEKESQKPAHSQIISQAHADVEDSYVCVFGSVLVLVCLFYSVIRPVFIRFSCIYVCLNAIIRRPDYEIFVVLRTVELSRVEIHTVTHMNQISTNQTHLFTCSHLSFIFHAFL